MVEQSHVTRPSRWGPLLLAGALAALLSAGWWITRPGSVPSSSAGYVTALEACSAQLSTSSAAPSIPGYWHVVVQIDRPTTSALVIIGGSTQLLCVTSRDETGRFTATSTGWGRITSAAPPALTYYSGEVLPGRDAASSLQAVVGQVPAGASAVVVSMSDGITGTAAVADGHYLALVNTTALPERIVAIDVSGAEVASLDDLSDLSAK